MVSVTDHALVRFIERVVGLNLEPFRAMIREDIDDVSRDVGENEGSRSYVIEGERVVTVLVGSMRTKKVKAARGAVLIRR